MRLCIAFSVIIRSTFQSSTYLAVFICAAAALAAGCRGDGEPEDGIQVGSRKQAVTTAALCSGEPISVQSAFGREHSCARMLDQTVRCVGRNDSGQVGKGSTSTRELIPITVQSLADVIHIAAGNGHTCAARSDGSVWCWGQNNSGQLGNGTTTNSASPVRVKTSAGFLDGVVQVSAGEEHTCAQRSDGTIRCWGYNGTGALGSGGGTSSIAVAVQACPTCGDFTASLVQAGGASTCAVSAGKVYCWGRRLLPASGDGTAPSGIDTRPIEVTGFPLGASFKGVALTGRHACALRDGADSQREVYCWGYNNSGQLGRGSTGSGAFNVGPQVSNLTDAVALATGGPFPVTFTGHTCAQRANGTAVCWGSGGSGELGNGAGTSSSVPVQVVGPGADAALPAPVTGLSLADRHTCAVLTTGVQYCWGSGVLHRLKVDRAFAVSKTARSPNMSKKPRRHYTPEQKAELLKKHHMGKVPISSLCDENQLQPSVFYDWQRRLFEKAPQVFVESKGPSARERELEQRVAFLEAKLAKKDSVIAEVSQEYVQLKKQLGEP